ncbi:peptide-N4-(N-acetyl-beta- glucosaminyl)asparagine amidase [Coelomomyces lativittatus]|nr:peptide-N4-(N-acetyl-beta- glucosaminyl)asparagine amidase [Coelomomyces lativittatus]
MDQAFILETLDWFKKSFFTWVDRIPCNFCNPSNDILIVAGSITMEERQRGVTRVELHECRHCHRSNRFPRLHSPIDVLNARRGRCGEWANAFLLIGKALGYETRYVMDWADHVWNEIKIPSLQRWVHVDVCENLMDAPMVYCLGWKKKLQRVYSIDGGYVMDVFDRYTKNETKPIKSPWLKRAEQQLCAYGLYFTSNKLACLMEQAYAYLDYQQTITSDSLQTRKSGDEQWKASRGECRTFPTHLSYLKPIQLTTCNLVGNARCIVDTLELTSNRTDQCGGTWLPQVLVPTESFCIEWTMQITGNGADGLAFVIQGVSIEALGEGGCGLGYAGIPRSLAIEFDTFYSPEQGDPDENHVSIQSCLKEPNSSHHEFSLGCFPFPVDLNEGVPIHVRILYEHGGQFSIWNQTSNQVWKELFTFHFPLKNLCDENTALYLGFTAATGGIAQRHVIQQIQFLKLN